MVIEAARRQHRHELHVLLESSIVFPALTDETVFEYESSLRDKFYLEKNNFFGPNYDLSVTFWPQYDVKMITRRVLRIWKLTTNILRTQSVQGLTDNKIVKLMKLVSLMMFLY